MPLAFMLPTTKGKVLRHKELDGVVGVDGAKWRGLEKETGPWVQKKCERPVKREVFHQWGKVNLVKLFFKFKLMNFVLQGCQSSNNCFASF